MNARYTINITQENHYACVEALYYGKENVNSLVAARYSQAIDTLVIGLLGGTHSIECLDRKTVGDVRSHEYKIDLKGKQ